MVDTRRLSRLVNLASADLALPDGHLVVALSGGADSAALAWLVARSSRQARAVHVDHGLPHSPMMRLAAIGVAAASGLELSVEETQVPTGASPEGQARSARYQAFTSAVGPGESLLTAHTAEDNAETVILNLTRGTGSRGLAGIPYFRPPNVYRPVLEVSRDDLREIAVLAGLPFADDPMNFEQAITRNHIRHQVMPRLREINPALAAAVRRMSTQLRSENEILDSLAGMPVSRDGGALRVAIGDLLARPRVLAERFLLGELAVLARVGPVGSEMLGRVWSVVDGSSTRQQISGSVEAWREGPFLVVGEVAGNSPECALTPGENRCGGLVLELAEIDAVCRVAPLSRWHALFSVGTHLTATADRTVVADGEPAWVPGVRRLPVACYVPGNVGYLSVLAKEEG